MTLQIVENVTQQELVGTIAKAIADQIHHNVMVWLQLQLLCLVHPLRSYQFRHLLQMQAVFHPDRLVIEQLRDHVPPLLVILELKPALSLDVQPLVPLLAQRLPAAVQPVFLWELQTIV